MSDFQERMDRLTRIENNVRLATLREVRYGIASRLYSGAADDMNSYEVGAHNARAFEISRIDAIIAEVKE